MRAARLWAELLAVFVGIPVALALGLPLPKIATLDAVALACAGALLADRAFDPRPELRAGFRRWGGWRAALLVGAAAAAGALLASRAPGDGAADAMLRLLGAYLVVSVVPQELVYRTFFFHRYRTLFPSQGALVAASAVAFAVLHVVFRNVPAVALTLVGGLVFARTYARTRSLAVVSLEHAVYGAASFALGLGRHVGVPL